MHSQLGFTSGGWLMRNDLKMQRPNCKGNRPLQFGLVFLKIGNAEMRKTSASC
jgi:hypothetical protein